MKSRCKYKSRRKCCKSASSRRPQRPLFELLEAREMLATDILQQAPTGVVGEAVREIGLEFSVPLMADAARSQDNYRLTYLGEDGVVGGEDDVVLPVLPQYLDGATMLRLSTLADLSGWTENDYGFPHGILGDWQLDATTGSVVQAANGGATFFASDADFIDREFAAQIVTETSLDDDFIGVVFGMRVDPTTELPDSYYLLAWKKTQAGGSPGGLRLARIAGTGEMGERPDSWRLSSSDPHIEVLATGPGEGWEAGVRYEFRVLQESDGHISVGVANAESGASVWTADVTDANPLGRGKVGFYNFSQQDVRHWNLRSTGSLPQGTYQIEVLGDANGLLDVNGEPIDGNSDGEPGGDYVGTFTVDIGVPTVGVDLRTESDTGVSASDNLTKDNTPTFDISTNRSGFVEIFVDGGLDPAATLGFGDAGTQAWTSAALADGAHTIRVNFIPDLGNVGETMIDVQIDTVAPYLLEGPTTEQAPVYSRTVQFSEAIDEISTTAGVVVSLLDPDGATVPLSNVSGTGDTYAFEFAPQIRPGEYTLAANTAIVDRAGNAVDQDRDGVGGEVGQDEPVDRFTVVADTQPPQVSTFSPQGLIKRSLQTMEVEFSEEIDPTSFTPSDVIVAGPVGTTTPAVFEVRSIDVTNRRYEIVLASSIAFDGMFTATIGPDVRDLSGNTLGTPYVSDFEIALPLPIPSIPGDGVFIELFNGVGGGTTPTPASLDGLSPDGTTLSPQIDFPRPGSVISVGDSFVNFFDNTAMPPDAVVNLSAANFILRHTFFVAVTPDMDLDPETPEIDVRFGVGSDDGFYLTVDDQFVGSASDRAFAYSWYDFFVESAGLFPVELLFAANAVGSSGLEFAWNTAISGGNQIIPQQYLYVSPLLGDQTITFEELPAGTVVTDQFRDEGILFSNVSGDLQVTNAFPTEFIPVSPDQVFADPTDTPASVGEVDLNFVVPGTDDAATTNFVSMYLIDAETVGATVTAFDPEGNIIFNQTVSDSLGGGSQKQVVIQRDRIARVNVTLGQGTDTTAIDNITFNTPTLLNSRPVIQPIADVQVNEETLLSFPVLVTDPDLPDQNLSYSLAPGAPAGATINVDTGFFSWTPGETQGPGSYPITVVVRDSGVPRLRDEKTFVVTVLETNKVPTLPEISGQTITIESPIEFTIVGADSDVPVQTLTYSLDPGAPSWASIDPTSGLFSAAVTGDVPDGTFPVTVRVTDDGAGTLSSTKTFNVFVDNDRPNLVAQDIAAAGPLTPGAPFTLNWEEGNIGSEAAAGTWTDRVYISNSPTGENSQLLASFTYSGSIAPGDPPVARSPSITLPQTSLNGPVYFVVEVDATNNVVESDESNLFVGTSPATVPPVLDLSFSASSVTEGGAALKGTLTRNGDVTQPLVVTLAPSVAGQLTLPPTVTIPAGQFIQRFEVSAKNDTVAESTQVVTVEATAAAFTAAVVPLTVFDNDQPRLTLTFPVSEATEGQVVRGRITRDLPATQDLLINVVSTDDAQLSVPMAVALPAGQSFVEFDATVVDDTLLEREAVYTVSINALGHVGNAAALIVPQNDVPNLTLAVPTMLPEGAYGPTVIGTLTRSIVTAQEVVVELTSTNSALVGVPATVTIPAGADSITFPIQIADDDLVNGSRSADITARVRPSAGGEPFAEGAATATQEVIDNDGPTLSVTFNRDTVAEGASATATIRRNTTDLSQSLLVTLQPSDETELASQTFVEIPAGADSVMIQVSGIEDNEVDGDQVVDYMATAADFNAGSASIVVVDIDLADLVVSSLTAPTSGLTNGSVNAAWTISNNGYATAEGIWTERVYISIDGVVGNDTLAGQYTFTGPLLEGKAYNRNVPVQLPNVPGDYWIVVEVDVANAVDEGLETNNTRITALPISVAPAYTATVMTDVEMAPADTPVLLTGSATLAGGGPAAFQQVSVHLNVRGTKRILPAVTKADGTFQVTFHPLPGEGGNYTVGAAHPGLADAPVQDSFQLVGMRAEPPSTAVTVTEAEPAKSDSVTIRNLADVPLTGVAVEALDVPANLQVTATLTGDATTLAEMGTLALDYSVAATDSSVLDGTFRLRITSNEAPAITVPVSFNVVPLVSRLVADPGSLNKSMLVGDQTSVEFSVTNTGGKATGPLSVLLPTGADWLTLATPATIASLAPGASTSITLLLTPPETLALTAYNGSLVVRGDATEVSVPFSFRAVSEETGDLEITVVDEFFYFAEDKPLVTDATVILRDAITGQQIASSANALPPAPPGSLSVAAASLPPTVTIDESGRVTFSGVPEGAYTLEVRADKHETYSNTVQVEAGELDARQVFISRNLVEYTWTVEEVEIEDRTRVIIDATFETNVPAPVVTVEGAIDVADLQEIGQSQQFDIKITNHGLIAAENVAFDFGTHPFYEIRPLIEKIGTLPAKSEVIVPVVVTRTGDFQDSGEAAAAVRGTGLESLAMLAAPSGETQAGRTDALGGAGSGAPQVPCGIAACVVWSYVCGVPVVKCSAIPVSNVEGNCPPGFFSPRPVSGPGGPGSITPVTISQAAFCNECLDDLAKATLDCILNFVPLPIPDEISVLLNIKSCLESGDGVGQVFAGCVAPFLPPPLSTPWNVFTCACGILTACKEFGVQGTQFDRVCEFFGLSNSPSLQSGALAATLRESAKGGTLVHRLEEHFTKIVSYMESFITLVEVDGYVFGRNDFFRTDAPENYLPWLALLRSAMAGEGDARRITSAEAESLKTATVRPSHLAAADIDKFVERLNRTVDYYDQGIFNLADVPEGESTDFIAQDGYRDRVTAALEVVDGLLADGIVDISQAVHDTAVDILDDLTEYSSDGVCAQVKLQVEQQAVQTRTAFDATLGISNETTEALENISVEVAVIDSAGNLATDLFGIELVSANNLNDVNGAGTLAPNALGSATWRIIPSTEAAAAGPTEYFVTGLFSYDEVGVTVEQTLLPTSITVHPQPELDLDYFLQRDVFSDDPHTEEVEPAQPFTLAVMVQNNGAGAAKNLHIDSAQPKIVENEKGLLIDFQITGTKVNGEDVQRSLTANFGTVNPGAIAIAEWQMESTLQGLFTEYDVSFEHESIFGDNRLSLIKSAEIHELIHVANAVQVDGDDGLPDFLVNDLTDPEDLPDTLYLSDGSVVNVSLGTNAVVDAPPMLGDFRVEVTADMESGWSYLKMDDPSLGDLTLVGVERSDGTMLPMENFWQTDRTFIGLGQRPVLEDKIHLLDYNSTGSYTFIFSNGDLSGPEVESFASVVPNPTTQAIDVVDATFSEQLDLASFDPADVSLTKNGAPVALSGIAISPVSGSTYRISGLAPFTADDAVYELDVDATGVTDQVGNAGVGMKSYRWVKGETAPTVLSLSGAPSGLVTQGPASIDIVFSKPVTGLDASDFSLTRDGTNLIDAQVSISQVGTSTYRLGNLARLTSSDGQYAFSVNAAGVQDSIGNAGLGSTTAEWTLDTTRPQLLDVIDPATNPRNIVVQQIDVEFSEPIDMTSLDVGDLRLVRDGGTENLIAGDSRVTFESRGNNIYRIMGINWVQAFVADPQIADFTLFVDATGVTDLAGNAGIGLLSSSWTLDLDKPAAASDLVVSTFSGPVTDGKVNARQAAVAGTLAEAGLTVAIRDMTTNTELVRQTIAGMTFSLPIEFPSSGQHRLRVRTIDPAGNTNDAFIENLFVSETPPVVDMLLGLPAAHTRSAVDFVDVKFLAPIDAATLTKAALAISRNGGANLVNGTVSIVPQADGKTFRFTGLAPITSDEGRYDFQLDLAGVKNSAGLVSSEVRSATWINDHTAPTSTIRTLEFRQDLNSFIVELDGDDPTLPGGIPPSGVVAFDIYVSDNGAPFQSLQTVAADSPTSTFVGEPNHLYYFRSVARDAAGNIELKGNQVDVWTYVPDLFAPETRVDDVDTADATLEVAFSGADRGIGLQSFELFVQVDGGGTQSVGNFSAGAPDADGNYSGSARYQAIADGTFHEYRFYTIGTDWDGNVELPVDAPADVTVNVQYAVPPTVDVVDFDVQKGADQRSFIRYLDVFFNTSSQLNDIISSLADGNAANDRIRLTRYGLDGSGVGTDINLAGRISAIDQALALDFGADGLGGDRNGTAGDGYYRLALDLDGNGSLETELAFYRLLGDANGNGIVDDVDLAVVNAALGQVGTNLNGDLNGDGRVNVLDRLAWQRGRGKSVAAGLHVDD